MSTFAQSAGRDGIPEWLHGALAEQCKQILHQLSALTGVELALVAESKEDDGTAVKIPVRSGARKLGLAVTASGSGGRALQAAEVAADLLGKLCAAEEDLEDLSREIASRYAELNFIYEMSERVGAVLDENRICAIVVEEAARLFGCQRASIMLADPQTGMLKIAAAVGLPENVSQSVAVRPGERISGKVFETGRPIIVNEGDPVPAESLNVSELREYRSFMSVPLRISSTSTQQGQVLGVLNLTRKRHGMFTAGDRRMMEVVADTAARQIHNCRLINAERQRQQLAHELELAARIQLSLLPKEPLRAGPFEVSGECKPARHVGGDLFDYWVLGNRLCLVVADVSGHDLGAALMANAFRSVLRSESAHRLSVADLMSQVNAALMPDLTSAELFISAFYAEVDLASGTITFCRAGHPEPLLLQLGEKAWLDTEGLLLGVTEDAQFEERSLQLDRGDTVVLYTDGILEAQNGQGKPFGTQGIRDSALANAHCAPREMVARIIADVQAHAGNALLRDDVTVTVLRFTHAKEI